MNKKYSIREEMDLKMRGRLPIERANPKKGESRWYYIDPRGRDENFTAFSKLKTIDVESPDVPNPNLQEIMLAEARENPENYYIWRTVGDDRVRASHESRDGCIFAWDEPPEGGHPGEDYNCRCSAEKFISQNYKKKKNLKYRLGTLSEKFESNYDPAIIGFDKEGGYSYGRYQIETQRGTMNDYINFLQKHSKYKNFAKLLNNVGGLEAAKNKTENFKNLWKELSSNHLFNQSQFDFIVDNKLNRLLSKISDIRGLNLEHRHPVIKDVLYSLAVQHGEAGGGSVIRNALPSDISNLEDSELIKIIYNERSKVDKYFSRSNDNVKKGVLNRFIREQNKALELLSEI